MKTSEQGLKLLIEREGSRNEAYLDSVGVPTIGVGHTGPDVHMGLALDQHQFDALVSFAFNVGAAAFLSSTMLRLINAGDLAGVPAQFDRWHIPPEITSRRNGEREQFKGTAFEARVP